MGLNHSKREQIPESNVFTNELYEVNKIVNNLINAKNIFINDEYNFFLKGKCDEVTVLNAKKLNKYKKYELDNLNEVYLMIPSSEIKTKKHEMCHNISMHFTRILKLIFCIKYIYDLENNGDKSIGGIITRNIKTKDDLLKVSYCESQQQELHNFERGVNFSMLSGFDSFIKHILDPEEGQIFLKQLKIIMNGYDKKDLKKWVCKDMIVNKELHSKIHKANFKCQSGGNSNVSNVKSVKSVKSVKNDISEIYIKVGPNNPILSWKLCSTTKKHISKNNKQLSQLIKNMKSNYSRNFKKIVFDLNKLVSINPATQEYNLRNLSHNDLKGIETSIKRTIIIFFIQSLSDYKNILNTIKLYSINNE